MPHTPSELQDLLCLVYASSVHRLMRSMIVRFRQYHQTSEATELSFKRYVLIQPHVTCYTRLDTLYRSYTILYREA